MDLKLSNYFKARDEQRVIDCCIKNKEHNPNIPFVYYEASLIWRRTTVFIECIRHEFSPAALQALIINAGVCCNTVELETGLTPLTWAISSFVKPNDDNSFQKWMDVLIVDGNANVDYRHDEIMQTLQLLLSGGTGGGGGTGGSGGGGGTGGSGGGGGGSGGGGGGGSGGGGGGGSGVFHFNYYSTSSNYYSTNYYSTNYYSTNYYSTNYYSTNYYSTNYY
ncbi:hypothetical protein BgiBS90_028886 [Biomphalaria glabrata]|nr:hypothetical protein BgiBS90_028886 [Biomphalaria glabrata]